MSSNEENINANNDSAENKTEAMVQNDETTFGELLDENVDEQSSDTSTEQLDVSVKPKKNRSLAVAACIFAATVIVFAVWYAFFDNDITGIWETEVDIPKVDGTTQKEKMKFSFEDAELMSFFDGEKSYFSDKEASNAKAEMINGGMVVDGVYVTSESKTDSSNIVSMYFMATGAELTDKYKLTGNIFTGKQLVLTDGNDDIIFTKSDKSYTLDPVDDFQVNNGVVGSWKYNDVLYTFDENGRFVEKTSNMYVEGVYTFGEENGYDAIIIKYKYNGEIVSSSIPYLLKGDSMTLTINGYNYDLNKVNE